MNTYTDHDGSVWPDEQFRFKPERHMFADLVAALEIARAYQAKCERLEADKIEWQTTCALRDWEIERLREQLLIMRNP